MTATKSSFAFSAILAVFALTLFSSAQQISVLQDFNYSGTDGSAPVGGVIFDSAGNLYGTTAGGGNSCFGGVGCGTVFELSPKGGAWTETVLYRFNSGTDGAYPLAGMIFDRAGNLYGTTEFDGTYGCGAVFELSPTGGGNWAEKVLYNFANSATDGCAPQAGLILDAAGNLYGTTTFGGNLSCYTYRAGCGTVFELIPQTGGIWTEKVLHFFTGKDGAEPYYAGVVFDGAGNLYGTTFAGGSRGFGTVFELTPKSHGHWVEKVLHTFNLGKDGVQPWSGLCIDAAGNLYGTTYAGGSSGYGTIFEVSPHGKNWTEKVIHAFSNNGTDGYQPEGNSLILDRAGNLYGTTTWGGAVGAAFELTPGKSGPWTETILGTFNTTNGSNPMSGLIFDAAGNLYGTTVGGGTGNGGTVFEIKQP